MKIVEQREGGDRQTATLLVWTPRTALFHTLKDSSKEMHMCRATSEFHCKGKKRITKFKIKARADLCSSHLYVEHSTFKVSK